jgi:hypothetical protein
MRTSIWSLIPAACLAWSGAASAQVAPPPPATTGAVVEVTPAGPTTTTIMPSEGATSLDLPARETSRSPINRPLLLSSFLLIGGTYGASAIDAATSGRDADHKYLYYPVVGPWMDYANRCDAGHPCNGNETGYKALLILDGVGQGLGALGMVTSLFIPERSTRNWFLIGGTDFHAAPSPVGTGYGLGAGGAF